MTTSTPQVGQIIRGRFPEIEHVFDCSCGKNNRPCLVLDLSFDQNGRAKEVLVAYGTSQHPDATRPSQFAVTPLQVPFLQKKTRFCLDRRLWLPISDFEVDGRLNLAGTLPTSVMLAFHQAALEAGLIEG